MRSKHSALVAVALMLLLAAVPVNGASRQMIGQAVAANGGLYISGFQVPSGTTLFDGDRVATSGSPAVLHLADGTRLQLAPRSEVILRKNGAAVTVVPQAGTMRSSANPDAITSVSSLRETASRQGAVVVHQPEAFKAGDTIRIQTPDRKSSEDHLVLSVEGQTLVLKGRLAGNYPAGAPVYLAQRDGVEVVVPASAESPSTAASASAAGQGGGSTATGVSTAVKALVVGAAAGAVAFTVYMLAKGDPDVVSPARP